MCQIEVKYHCSCVINLGSGPLSMYLIRAQIQLSGNYLLQLNEIFLLELFLHNFGI